MTPDGLVAGLVTVVVPARNEEASLDACLRSIRSQDEADLEILVVDGASTDGTAALVARHAAEDPRVRLLANPERIVPTALNHALRAARGEYLVRVDAHATVPPGYVRAAVAHLRTGRWGGVGGRKDGVGRTAQGRAVARAMASPFGVGNSTYHHGTEPRPVDHVPFGAYPTRLARALGGWDERLRVNQDYEFDYRVRRAGHELLFDPALRIDWECRQSVADLFRQYRRYGRGKARVAALHPSSVQPRHGAAPALVAWLAGAAVVARRRPALGALAAAPYAAGVAAASATAARGLDRAARAWLPAAFVAMHVGWGIGFWEGVGELARERAAVRRGRAASAPPG